MALILLSLVSVTKYSDYFSYTVTNVSIILDNSHIFFYYYEQNS